MGTGRLEAFSDGVFAIAITLLVLDLHTPEGHAEDLGHALARLWPNYATYAVSFLIIGIIWMTHHEILSHIAKVDRTLLTLNLILLLIVAVIPFPTSVLATYLQEGSASHIAAAVYSLTMLVHAISMGSLWWWAVSHPHLLEEHVDLAEARHASLGFAIGIPIYLLAIVLSFVNAYVVLAMHFVVAALYLGGRLQVRPRRAAG